MASLSSFKLSLQLEGHTADVRSVAATSLGGNPLDTLLLSASRDGNGRIWSRPEGSKSKRELVCRFVLEGHEGFVNSCAWFLPGGATLAVTGGQDKTINAYDIGLAIANGTSTSLLPEYTLLGHEDNICALDVFNESDGYIVSGSWDRTARVWKNWNCVAILAGHTQAVWAVLALTEDLVLTASADKLIRLYSIQKASKQGKDSTPIAVFSGHSDAVRGLVQISHTSFASCSNDGNISIFHIPQASSVSAPVHPTQTLSGHTSFVYSLALLADGSLASSGEDRSVRIWKDGSLLQTVTVPAISIWSVTALANGDFACGSSDGTVRVFTKVQQRVADSDVLQVYDSAVSSQALNKTQVGDVQKESLPGAEELSQPGKEGQVKMIRSGELVEAYQYSSSNAKWEKIGEVVGGVGSGQKKLYQGKEYDYVFDVDIADGVPPLKLPYNATENPYNAAYRFLEKNQLPQTYLDQVVGFIEKNSAAVSLGSSNEFVDPYTGASSYRPGAPSAPLSSASSAADTKPPAAAAAISRPPPILPQRVPLTFKQFNEQGAKAKIEEFNRQLTGDAALSPEEVSTIFSLMPTLTALSTNTATFAPIQLQTIQGALTRWPLSHRFPLLDIYRLACAGSVQGPIEPATCALQAAQWSGPWPSSAVEAKTRGTLSLLALRAVCNVLSTSSNVSLTQILSELQKGSHFAQLAKPARVAYVTVLFNISTKIIASGPNGTNDASVVVSLLSKSLESEREASLSEGEVIYRAIVALGNLLVSSSSGTLAVGAVTKAKTLAEQCTATSKEPRIKAIFDEVQQHGSAL